MTRVQSVGKFERVELPILASLMAIPPPGSIRYSVAASVLPQWGILMRVVGWLSVLASAFVFAAEITIAQDTPPTWHGVTVSKVTPALKAKYNLLTPVGVVITEIRSGSAAAKSSLRVGDLILSLDDKPTLEPTAFADLLKSTRAGSTISFAGMRASTGLKVSILRPRPKRLPLRTVSEPPQLMLDTGGHMSLIRDLQFTPDGQYIISAGDDKVIRIWDWRSGKTVRTIRGQVGRGVWGAIYAIALSPDGRLLAVGGVTADRDHHIRLYDFSSGKQVSLLRGHRNTILDLAFSKDGSKLISGQFGRPALAILWDVSKPQAPRLLHRLKGHLQNVRAVRFLPDGKRAITGSDDGLLRLWRVRDGRLIKELRGHRGDIDQSLAVRQSDGVIASGDFRGEIRLWDGKSGAFLRTLAVLRSGVRALTFSPDGQLLLASHRLRPNHAFVLDASAGTRRFTYTAHASAYPSSVFSSAISPDGRYAATASGPNWQIHVWELATGKRFETPNGQPLSLVGTGGPRWAVGFSADGQRIAWGNRYRFRSYSYRGPLQYQLRLPTKVARLGQPEKIVLDQPFVRASTKFGSVSLSHRKGGKFRKGAGILDISRNGKRLFSITRDSFDGYGHWAYTFSHDGKTIISGGSNGMLGSYYLTGQRVHPWSQGFIGHDGQIMSVVSSPDGRFLVSGGQDQTVRLWNVKTRELIVTLFQGDDGKWLIWTPQGFYSGSPGAGKIVGWQINKGYGKEADYVTGQQVRKTLLRPDIVERAIVLGSAKAAVKEAGLERLSIADVLEKSPPKIRMEAEWRATRGRGTLGILFEPNALPVIAVKAFVDGVRVTLHEIDPPPGKPTTHPDGSKLKVYEVPLHKGENVVRVVAVNSAGESLPKHATIIHLAEGELDRRGTLWLLAVGVDKYPGVQKFYRHLRYAGRDARVFAATVQARMKRGHERIDATVLVNGGSQGEPTADNIRAALKRISTLAKDNDTVMVFLAGHGETWTGGRYHFLPTDAERHTRNEMGRNMIAWTTVRTAITKAKGRRLIFVDACRTGPAGYNARLLQDANADGYIAFNAASANQAAREYERERHGAFAYALIEGLRGKAYDPTVRGVTVYKLGNFVFEKVFQRTDGFQTPEYYPGQGGNVVLTRIGRAQ